MPSSSNYWPQLASLPAIFFSEDLWQQPLCLDVKTARVLSEQVSSKASSESHRAFSFSSPALSQGGPEGLQGRACPVCRCLRGTVCRHPVASQQQPCPQACAVHSRLFSVHGRSVPREADRGVCVSGQLSSLLNAPFCTCFSLSAATLELYERSLGAQAAAVQQSAACRKADHQ